MLVDMHGREIKEFDVLKMYHFTDTRRKKHYMYKWVIVKDGYMYGHHLGRNGARDAFLLQQYQLANTEIVQGFDKDGKDFADRPKVKK